MNDRESPLKGIKVLDLADQKASFCSKLLADMGACVIKVEKPGGDRLRSDASYFKDNSAIEGHLSFWYNNTNKKGVTLDIEKDEGRDIFKRLVSVADVIVETNSPGYLDKLHLGFDVLEKINPGLIVVSVTGFGQSGPKSKFNDGDLVVSAFGGQMFVTGAASTPPLCAYGAQSFYVTSLFCAVGILLALHKRHVSGKGEHIDVSAQEAVASTLEHTMVRYFHDHIIPKRRGNLSWNGSSFICRCKDGFIHINIGMQWETLVEWMASEDKAEDLADEEWRDEAYRLKNVNHIIEVVQNWTKLHSMEELFELAQSLRFPWGPVYTPEDVLNSPQLKARGFFIEVDHPELGGAVPYPGKPWRFDNSALKRFKRAPIAGEDNFQVYHDLLGLSKDEIERLSSLSII